MLCVFPAATLIDVHNDESFLPLQPQFKDKLLACINMLSTTDYWVYICIAHHFMQMFQSDISYLAMVWNEWFYYRSFYIRRKPQLHQMLVVSIITQMKYSVYPAETEKS